MAKLGQSEYVEKTLALLLVLMVCAFVIFNSARIRSAADINLGAIKVAKSDLGRNADLAPVLLIPGENCPDPVSVSERNHGSGFIGEADFLKAASIDPSNPRSYINLMRGYLLGGEYGLAQEVTSIAQQTAPDDMWTDLAAARNYAANGREDRAYPLWQRQSVNRFVFYLAQKANASNADFECVEQLYLRAISIEPIDPLPYSLLADFYMSYNQQAKAAAAYAQASNIYPKTSLEYYLSKGYSLRIQKEWEEAISLNREAIEKFPGNPGLYYEIAYSTYRQNNSAPDEAIGYLSRALEIQPDYVWAYLAIGEIRGDQARYDESMEWYMRAISVSPGTSIAWERAIQLSLEKFGCQNSRSLYDMVPPEMSKRAGLVALALRIQNCEE